MIPLAIYFTPHTTQTLQKPLFWRCGGVREKFAPEFHSLRMKLMLILTCEQTYLRLEWIATKPLMGPSLL